MLLMITAVIFLVSFPTFIVSSGKSCSGGFDVYFVLDRSQSVSSYNFQNKTVQFVEDVVTHLVSSKLRVSILAFSNNHDLVLPITRDRQRIYEGINNLKRVRPSGTTYLLSSLTNILNKSYLLNDYKEKVSDNRNKYYEYPEAFITKDYVYCNVEKCTQSESKVLDQIKATGSNTASVVIILTDGNIYDDRTSYEKTKELQILGTSIFTVGVEGYKLEQLEKLASTPASEHVFTVENYQALQTISDKIINKACVEVTNIDPNAICVGESPSITLSGKGFRRLSDQSKIMCRFIMNNTFNVVRKATQVTDSSLHCPGPPTKDFKGSTIGVQVSVNGITFVTSDRSISVIHCQPARKKSSVALVLVLLGLLLLGLMLIWWFWKLLPCVKSKKRKHHDNKLLSVGEDTATKEEPTKKKWATVDASFYGGGGVGGVKPIRVNWGGRGSTEAGTKLTKTPDAKVLSPNDDEESNVFTDNPTKPPSCFSGFQQSMSGCFSRLSELRPQKGGRSRLYSSVSER